MSQLLKKYAPWIVVVLFAVVLLWMANQVFGVLPAKLREAELKYHSMVKVYKERDLQANLEIARLLDHIKKQDGQIILLKQETQQAKDLIKVLNQTIAELQANEPSYPELETHPLVINLRAQIAKLSEGFSLAQATIVKQDEIIRILESEKVDLYKAVSLWEDKYNREHALRLSSEALYAKSKKTLGLIHISGTIKDIVIGGLALGVIYSVAAR